MGLNKWKSWLGVIAYNEKLNCLYRSKFVLCFV